MFERIRIMRVLRFFNNKYFPQWLQVRLKNWSEQAVEDIRKTKVIFFAKDANLQMLSKAAQYVIKNESGLWLVVVHFFDDEHSPMLQVTCDV